MGCLLVIVGIWLMTVGHPFIGALIILMGCASDD